MGGYRNFFFKRRKTKTNLKTKFFYILRTEVCVIHHFEHFFERQQYFWTSMNICVGKKTVKINAFQKYTTSKNHKYFLKFSTFFKIFFSRINMTYLPTGITMRQSVWKFGYFDITTNAFVSVFTQFWMFFNNFYRNRRKKFNWPER